MQKFTLSLLFASSLLMASAASCAAEEIAAPTAETVQQALQAAEAARQQADAVEYEWRDTAKVIKQAQAALANNDLAKALQLAELAKLQSDMAVLQAKQQKTAEPRF